MKKPVVLMILDGWGANKAYIGNAIHRAHTPCFDNLLKHYRHGVLQASEQAVGLPAGVFGNSEVGHITLGAGRVLYQDLLRIDKSIESGEFFANAQLLAAVEHVKRSGGKLHVMGLLSDGRVHSSNEHLFALLALAKRQNLPQVFVHAFLDGRDTPRDSGLKYLRGLEAKIAEVGIGKIASITGRFWAMDRDNNWERVGRAYQALTAGSGEFCQSATEQLEQYYQSDVFDEEVPPTVVQENGQAVAVVADGDAIIFFNYRADRAREITRTFVDQTLEAPALGNKLKFNNLCFVGFTQYKADLAMGVAFGPEYPSHTLGQVLAEAGLRQLRIAETEKYAHVTYFFNGGVEQPGVGEERILVPSPKVESYAEQPEMSAPAVATKVLEAVAAGSYDFILINFANADMVGHTGNMEAAITAVETVDAYLGQISQAVLNVGGQLLVTADHGNADEMLTSEGAIAKEHSINLVPVIFVGENFVAEESTADLHEQKPLGSLADVAPTILTMMELSQPIEMTGHSLL